MSEPGTSTTQRGVDEQLASFFNYLLTDPCNNSVDMDCCDCCEHTSMIAEQVANGRPLRELMPELAKHMHCYTCVQEEFQALTAILAAEQSGLIESVDGTLGTG
ncbi:MAG: hypothetical protein OXF83_09760 [Anaerolineaceae bacterium]|nr:hypothetical protein [Anaerolineaceae bacterium]MCY3934382.1 hypothetical protein [Chloroflexota bacterium]